MADIAIFRINYKSDFILTLQSDAGWLTPFCIKFWTGAPTQAYFVGYNGSTYTHCAPVDGDPTRLTVQFDNHNLPIGNLKFQIAYHFSVADFPTSVEDEVINQASVIIEVDDAPAQVMLDFQGETAPEIEFSLPAYANEAQRIANEEERERVFAQMQAENADAVEGAENVNAELSGNTLTVTDRNGNSTSVNTKGEPGIGIPAGGTTNQVLVKESDESYDVMWRNAPASGVSSVNGKYGDVVLNATDVGAQPVISDLSEIRSGAAKGATALQQSDITPVENDIDAIEAKIPSAASASNQLADKNFVNSSIATNTANFVGTFNSLAELQAVQNPTNNDYGFVIETDAQGNEYYDRYKYAAASQQWLFEYKVESTPFTAAQWAAIQSGITSALVTKLNALPTNAELQQALTLINNTLANKADIDDVPTELSQLSQDSTHRVVTDAEKTAWNGKADKVEIVNHGTSDTTFTLTPNIFHVWGTVASLTLTLATASTTTMDEFMFQFTSGTTATTLSLPSTVKWVAEPEIEAGMTYQVSIVNNIAVIGGVA